MIRRTALTIAWRRWLAGNAPALPEEFDDYVPPFEAVVPAHLPTLVVVSGIPGTGKSELADALGRKMAAPVFAFDWVLGAILPKLPPVDRERLGAMGYELLVTLALRQLAFGQSVVLDATAEDEESRRRVESLAKRFRARLKVVECICSDEDVHRSRLGGRMRWIPGWNQTVDWSERLVARRDAFRHWDADTLVLDAVEPLEDNVRAATEFVMKREDDGDSTRNV